MRTSDRDHIGASPGLRPEAVERLRISLGKAQRIAVKMALQRMNTELARSRVQLSEPY